MSSRGRPSRVPPIASPSWGEARNEASRTLADELAAAVKGGESLEDAARARELTLERSGWLRRRPDGFVPGLGASPDLMATAFTLEPGQSSSRVFEVGDKLALVQLPGIHCGLVKHCSEVIA